MRIKHAVTAAAVALLCLPALAACGSDDEETTSTAASGGSTASAPAEPGKPLDKSKPPVRFALNTLKIPGSDLMKPLGDGADAAAKMINAAGGFGGREVIIDRCNTMGQPSTAVNCARQTLAKNPIAEFGCEVSWGSTGLKLYAAKKVPSFNCLNTPDDFNNPWSFGINASGLGEQRGMAKYLCKKPDVKKVAMFVVDLPQLRRTTVEAVDATFKACGKEVQYEYFPLTAADLAPYVQRVVKGGADFVVAYPLSGPQGVQTFKVFAQAGIPASKISVPSSTFAYETVLEPAGKLAEGAHSMLEYTNWDDESDPDVAEYLKAMEGSDSDPRNGNVQMGYHAVKWFHVVAEQVGFDEFDAETLTKFMREENDVQMPLARKMVNPGPKGYPQVRQPQVQLVQWKDGEVKAVEEGTDGGWVDGY